jgi:hypothetical protein
MKYFALFCLELFWRSHFGLGHYQLNVTVDEQKSNLKQGNYMLWQK